MPFLAYNLTRLRGGVHYYRTEGPETLNPTPCIYAIILAFCSLAGFIFN